MTNNKTKGFLLGAIAAASYGMNPLFTLPLYSAGMSVDSVLFYRYALAIVVLGIMMKMQKQSFAIKKADVLPLCIMGLLFSFSSLFLFMSYNYMDAGIASTILFVYPVLVAIIMAVVFKEKVSPVTMFSIALAFVGISLLCKSPGGQTLSLVGITFVFLSSLSYAIYIVGVNRSSLKDMPIAKLTFYVLLFGLSVYVVRLKFCTGLQPIPTPLLWVNAVSLAVFPTVISLVTMTKAIHYIGSTPTAILGALEPVTALFFGVLIFGEQLTPRIILGILMVITAVTLIIGGKTLLKKSKIRATGITVRTTTEAARKNSIILAVDGSITNKEGYQLEVTSENIHLNGGSESGVFYGIQTLYKALPLTKNKQVSAAIPVGTVNDYPRFGYRGFMVDVGRHYFPVSYLKQIIDMLALHNINYFHWHLTEDQGWRIEIKKYPKLTEIGSMRPRTLIDRETQTYDETPHSGFYTQEEAKEIVKYAADRFITVIPEVDLPGHMMGALVSYPELGCTGGPYEIPCKWGVFPDVLCGGNDRTLQFAKDVLNEIMDIFPSPYIHIGGDECPKVRWEKCPVCQAKIRELGLKDTPKHSKENQLQTYFMSEVGKVINDRGRKMLGWDEMLEGGLAPGATVMSWTGVKGGIEAARLHHDAIMTPIQYLYFSNPTYNRIKGTKSLGRVYTFEPVSNELAEDERKYIIGTQGCIWTEWTRDSLKMEWQILPRMAALSEIQWTEPSHKNFDSFLKRLPALLAIYRDRGYDFRQDIYDVNIDIVPAPDEGKARIAFQTFDDAEIHYTLDGSVPDVQSPLYTDTIQVDKDVIIQAIAVRPQGASQISKEEIHFNAATMRPVTLNTIPHKSYTFKGGSTLIDGLYGDMNYRSGRWIGFYGTDMNVTLDLLEPKEVSSVFVNTMLNTGDAIFGTTGLKVEVSEDGKNFRRVASEDFPVVEKGTKMQSRKDSVSFDKVKARYIKIIAEVTPKLPAWHSMPGEKAFLFVDEIGVE